jgi:hypothetical protein
MNKKKILNIPCTWFLASNNNNNSIIIIIIIIIISNTCEASADLIIPVQIIIRKPKLLYN